jgi:hypothetical protein
LRHDVSLVNKTHHGVQRQHGTEEKTAKYNGEGTIHDAVLATRGDRKIDRMIALHRAQRGVTAAG